MNKKDLIANLTSSFVANFFSLAVSLLSTLLIPKIMGETAFGYWQLYIFYISYAGLLHLGLCDGIYLRYGGKDYSTIDKIPLTAQFYTMVIYVTFLVVVIFFGAEMSISDVDKLCVVGLTCVGALIHVIKTYLLQLLQTTNQIKKYSAVTVFDRLVFVSLLIVATTSWEVSYQIVILCDISGRVLSLGLSIFYCREVVINKPRFSKMIWKEMRGNFASGSMVLLSGVASNLVVGIMRIGMEQNWSIEVFGHTSLSLSVLNMFFSFITVMGLVFFPILKNIHIDDQKKLFYQTEQVFPFFLCAVLLVAFPVKWIMEIWLPQYSISMQYMVIIMPMCVLESENTLLYITYLKALRKERVMALVNLFVMGLSVVLSYFTTVVLHDITLVFLGINLLIFVKTFAFRLYLYQYYRIIKMRVAVKEVLFLIIYVAAVLLLREIIAASFVLLAYGLLILSEQKSIRRNFVALREYYRKGMEG